MQEGMKIESGAADKDGQPPRTGSLNSRLPCHLMPQADGTAVCGIHHAIKFMRCRCFIVRHRPRREYLEIPVNLHAVSIDQRAVKRLSQAQSEPRLA